MATTKKKPAPPPLTPPPAEMNGPAGEVLTLAEAAGYLRLSEDDVVALVHGKGLTRLHTGRTWRCLKAAIQRWLSTGALSPQARKEAQLALAGKWKDDPDIEEIVREAYRRRGRPMTEGE